MAAYPLDIAPAIPRSGIIASAEQHGRVYLDARALSTLAKFSALSNVQPSKLRSADELIHFATPASLNTAGVWLLANPTFLVTPTDNWLSQDPHNPSIPAYIVTSSPTPFTARLKSALSFSHPFRSIFHRLPPPKSTTEGPGALGPPCIRSWSELLCLNRARGPQTKS